MIVLLIVAVITIVVNLLLYRLDEKKVAQMQREIEERKAASVQ